MASVSEADSDSVETSELAFVLDSALKSVRFALFDPARSGKVWGDTLLLQRLADALASLSYPSAIFCRDDWSNLSHAKYDVSVSLSGAISPPPLPGRFNVVWWISSSVAQFRQDLKGYDRIWVSSEESRDVVETFSDLPCVVIPQPPLYRHDSEIEGLSFFQRDDRPIYVGSGLNREYRCPDACAEVGLRIDVIGPDWKGRVPNEWIIAEALHDRELINTYRRRRFALSDSHASMDRYNIVNPRVLDIALAGAVPVELATAERSRDPEQTDLRIPIPRATNSVELRDIIFSLNRLSDWNEAQKKVGAKVQSSFAFSQFRRRIMEEVDEIERLIS